MIRAAGAGVKTCMMAYAASMPRRRAFDRSRPGFLLMPPAEQWNRLLQRVAQTRDRAAYGELFEHFAPRIKSYLMRLGTPPGQAEDLAQEAMLTLWRKAALFDPARASASTWMFTIARNLRIDAIRKERRPQFELDDPTLALDPEPDADAGLEMQESENALRQAMRVLPPDQNEIVMQFYFSDKPHSQIAADLGIPLGTVKSRLRLAMARLRAAMGEAP
jgi:RNA polymerase sigma-70 factor (ECF subfamily)